MFLNTRTVICVFNEKASYNHIWLISLPSYFKSRSMSHFEVHYFGNWEKNNLSRIEWLLKERLTIKRTYLRSCLWYFNCNKPTTQIHLSCYDGSHGGTPDEWHSICAVSPHGSLRSFGNHSSLWSFGNQYWPTALYS